MTDSKILYLKVWYRKDLTSTSAILQEIYALLGVTGVQNATSKLKRLGNSCCKIMNELEEDGER